MPSVIYLFPNPSLHVQDRARAGDHGLHRLAGVWTRIWLERISYRRMLRKELLPQPDSVLADAGLDRAAVLLEVSKPFWRA
ncbi:DUF1127 domain-containing protein [Pannonibacter phragmitetus]|uniref:DUF1127 domain-containing protein n=1 Tax=Pannonibacter phragmitetus TaxID=121719 RepID=UPI000F03E196|nr:hypothetical protein [Pannonibacter phragmitetus]